MYPAVKISLIGALAALYDAVNKAASFLTFVGAYVIFE
jgi:hypothetical protein